MDGPPGMFGMPRMMGPGMMGPGMMGPGMMMGQPMGGDFPPFQVRQTVLFLFLGDMRLPGCGRNHSQK